MGNLHIGYSRTCRALSWPTMISISQTGDVDVRHGNILLDFNSF
jgi:hypothetical protein